ncbi:MAG: acetoacetyl-CoA reductase [Holosporaceae bacterium]|jgi:acetoacetyl-CoA reductase|nr:acetoacetyl-CoA reductase [Holosporaceae bacterium]
MKRIALVTGGIKGIGGGISRALKKSDYIVAANYQKDEEAAKRFRKETGIPVFSWDVSDYDSCKSGIKKVCDSLGGSIDVLVNNAGITRDSMLHKMKLEDWEKVIAVDLNSVFNMCHLIIGNMREKKFGRIINISSVNGIKGQVGQTNYSAAKAGIIGFSKALALESASKGITVNVIAPGYISTDMTDAIDEKIKESIKANIPLGRFGQIEEVAHSVLFLAEDKSSFITGAVISVNGGQYL